MITIKEIIPEDHAYLIPVGDCHIGDAFFTKHAEEKLRGYIDWVKQHPNARVFLNGDIFNVATRTSVTSPFERNERIADEMEFAVEIFKPIADQIIGATDGNHEFRLIDLMNYSLMNELCRRLTTKNRNIIYCGISCLLFLKVGRAHLDGHKAYKNRPNRTDQTYSGYLQHTTGGGATIGGKMNRVDKLRQIVAGCDFYCGSHNHLEGAVKNRIYIPNPQNCTVTEVRQMEIDCGGFLDYGGYAERGMLPPTDIGVPRIRFSGGEKKDIHISL